MESAATNSTEPSKNVTRTRQKTIILVVFLTFTTLLLTSSFLGDLPSGRHHGDQILTHSAAPPPPLYPLNVKNACSNTLYPSFCFASLSFLPASKNAITFHDILEIGINQTVNFIVSTQSDITLLLTHRHQYLSSQEKNALNDCMEMLDQALYELGQAIDDLYAFPASIAYLQGSYGNLKTLLSAAMTNEHTCIAGLSDLEEADSETHRQGLKEYVQNMLTPISRMISNCLAVIKHMETVNREQTLDDLQMLITKMPRDGFPKWMWMAAGDRKLMERAGETRADVVVATDGSGHYCTITEAVRMAPNRSMKRFVIKVKAGVYKENVEISREKANIMLVGDGMNSTVITGSRNFADGFSTFTSATLTVAGDKFLARDLSILNTAGPQKHQAVAVRVTSNAAFYRCHFSSFQDTVYAHSLRQFYRECVIQGTIDFIFGNAAAIFQNCLILVRKPSHGQKNVITAQGREDPNQNTGISLHNCTIVAARDFAPAERQHFATFLGRPWRNYSRTMVMKSYLGELIHPEGWCEWDKYSTLDSVDYIEYMNFGPGSDTTGRVTWGGYRKNCSEDVAKQFTVEAFLHGADRWLESTGFPLFHGP